MYKLSELFEKGVTTAFYFVDEKPDGSAKMRVLKQDCYDFDHPEDYDEIDVASISDVLGRFSDFVECDIDEPYGINNQGLKLYAHPDSILYINKYNDDVGYIINFRFEHDDINEYKPLRRFPNNLPDTFDHYLVSHMNEHENLQFATFTAFHPEYFRHLMQNGHFSQGTLFADVKHVLKAEDHPDFKEKDIDPEEQARIDKNLERMIQAFALAKDT